MPAGDFGSHMALMRGAVGQHGVTCHVTNRKDTVDVRAATCIDWDDAPVVDLNSGSVSHNFEPVRTAADRLDYRPCGKGAVKVALASEDNGLFSRFYGADFGIDVESNALRNVSTTLRQ